VNPTHRPTTTTRRAAGAHRRRAVAALATLALVAAACGDDEDASNADTAPAAAATTAPMTDDTMTEAVPETAMPGGSGMDEMAMPTGPACSAVPTDGEGSFTGMADDPAATAASKNPVLSTLVTAVQAAGLVDTLNGPGPFTIFAPTNDAFAAIPADQLDAVLADTDLLTSVLTYHVVAGEQLDAEALAAAGEVTTVQGGTLDIGGGGTTVNGAAVVCSNVTTANATVHIIDTVLMPPADDMSMDESAGSGMDEMAMPTGPACSAVPTDGEGSFTGMADDPAATAASNNPVLSTLVTAVQAAGLVDTLNGPGPFTIFAPTNDAFAAIPADQLDAVLADTDLLTSVLTYHVVAGEQLGSADLVEAGTVTTVQGGTLDIVDDGGTLTVNGAPVVCMDVPTANATVHIIGAVLLPG
jgi:uncharacterized surface protein with fasciclin (FAS1) repeats